VLSVFSGPGQRRVIFFFPFLPAGLALKEVLPPLKSQMEDPLLTDRATQTSPGFWCAFPAPSLPFFFSPSWPLEWSGSKIWNLPLDTAFSFVSSSHPLPAPWGSSPGFLSPFGAFGIFAGVRSGMIDALRRNDLFQLMSTGIVTRIAPINSPEFPFSFVTENAHL